MSLPVAYFIKISKSYIEQISNFTYCGAAEGSKGRQLDFLEGYLLKAISSLSLTAFSSSVTPKRLPQNPVAVLALIPNRSDRSRLDCEELEGYLSSWGMISQAFPWTWPSTSTALSILNFFVVTASLAGWDH